MTKVVAHRSLVPTEGLASVEAAGLLARTALAVSHERMGGCEPSAYLEGEKELRIRIVDAVRSRLGVSSDDHSPEALLSVEDALDAEIEAIAEPPNLEAAMVRVLKLLEPTSSDGFGASAGSTAADEHVDTRKLLEQHPLFGRLKAQELDRLLILMRGGRYPRGTVLFRKGDPGTGMFVVLCGRVKVCTHSEEGKELVANLFSPGDVFGELTLFDGADRTADAVTLDASELMMLERKDFLPFLRDHPDACIELMAVFCEKLRETSALLEEALLLERPSRLAKRLARLAEAVGKPVEGGTQIDLPLSQRQLGNMVNMSPASTRQHLRRWREADLIRIQHGRYVIPDIDALQAM